MTRSFLEHLLFQVKPDKLDAFENLLAALKPAMAAQPGCQNLIGFKRFYTFDGVELGQPPRELTKIVKCVKYFALWQFDTSKPAARPMAG